MTSQKLHIWEAALMMAFAITLMVGMWAGASQSALAGEVLRLHVVANSDSQEDQAVKLQVRDAVLGAAAPLLEGIDSPQQAEETLRPHLAQLAQAGAEVLSQAGYSYPITVSITDQWFPTKEYEGFSLPAGTYRSLQVILGEGAGQNWWCVVFPPLCVASVSETTEETAAMAGMSDDQIALITGQDGNYVLRFRIIEWWEEFTAKLAN